MIGNFLRGAWRQGALAGSRESAAFIVRCDRSTMTQNDLDQGRPICEIGIAALRPAEFVIFRIFLHTAHSRRAHRGAWHPSHPGWGLSRDSRLSSQAAERWQGHR